MLKKSDGGLIDGDVLELSPDDFAIRASAPHATFGEAIGRRHAHTEDTKDYNPDFDAMRPHVPGIQIEKLGPHRTQETTDPRSVLEYTPQYSVVEPSSTTHDFSKVTGRAPDVISQQRPDGDVLILDPDDTAMRRSTAAVDLMHQTGRDDGSRKAQVDARDYDPDLEALDAHMPLVRLDTGGRPVEKKPETADVMYDGDDTMVRQSAPAAVFGPMTGRDMLKKSDGGLIDGDVLELSPDDFAIRASAPHATFGLQLRVTPTHKSETAECDYDSVDIEVLKPRSTAVDFSRAQGRAELEPAGEDPLDGETLDYDPVHPGLPRLDRGIVRMERQVGREELAAEADPDETDYDPSLAAVRPRTDRLGVNMERTVGRESLEDLAGDNAEDDRDYSAKPLSPPRGVLQFDGQVGREDIGELEREEPDERDYAPNDALTRPAAPAFTFDQRVGHVLEEGELDDRPDYNVDRASTLPDARATDFAAAPERADDPNDGGLSGPGTATEREAAADRPFYDLPSGAVPTPMVEMRRQVGREELELDAEPDERDFDQPLDLDSAEAARRPRVAGRVEFEQQVGRESLDEVGFIQSTMQPNPCVVSPPSPHCP
jgi:hypothetical protein